MYRINVHERIEEERRNLKHKGTFLQKVTKKLSQDDDAKDVESYGLYAGKYQKIFLFYIFSTEMFYTDRSFSCSAQSRE